MPPPPILNLPGQKDRQKGEGEQGQEEGGERGGLGRRGGGRRRGGGGGGISSE